VQVEKFGPAGDSGEAPSFHAIRVVRRAKAARAWGGNVATGDGVGQVCFGGKKGAGRLAKSKIHPLYHPTINKLPRGGDVGGDRRSNTRGVAWASDARKVRSRIRSKRSRVRGFISNSLRLGRKAKEVFQRRAKKLERRLLLQELVRRETGW